MGIQSQSLLQMIVQLFKGLMKVYTNQTNIFEGGTAPVDHKEKDQAAGSEIAKSFILCGHQADKMHIKCIFVFIHNVDCVEVAQGWLTDNGSDIDVTRLEYGMSFLKVKSSITMRENLWQRSSAICINSREIATGLEAVAAVDNPYSLIAIFGETT